MLVRQLLCHTELFVLPLSIFFASPSLLSLGKCWEEKSVEISTPTLLNRHDNSTNYWPAISSLLLPKLMQCQLMLLALWRVNSNAVLYTTFKVSRCQLLSISCKVPIIYTSFFQERSLPKHPWSPNPALLNKNNHEGCFSCDCVTIFTETRKAEIKRLLFSAKQ